MSMHSGDVKVGKRTHRQTLVTIINTPGRPGKPQCYMPPMAYWPTYRHENR